MIPSGQHAQSSEAASAGQGRSRLATCQFSVYPMGTADYMDIIAEVVDLMQERGVFGGMEDFCSRLNGSIEAIFAALEAAVAKAATRTSHVVVTAQISCNSPSNK